MEAISQYMHLDCLVADQSIYPLLYFLSVDSLIDWCVMWDAFFLAMKPSLSEIPNQLVRESTID